MDQMKRIHNAFDENDEPILKNIRPTIKPRDMYKQFIVSVRYDAIKDQLKALLNQRYGDTPEKPKIPIMMAQVYIISHWQKDIIIMYRIRQLNVLLVEE